MTDNVNSVASSIVRGDLIVIAIIIVLVFLFIINKKTNGNISGLFPKFKISGFKFPGIWKITGWVFALFLIFVVYVLATKMWVWYNAPPASDSYEEQEKVISTEKIPVTNEWFVYRDIPDNTKLHTVCPSGTLMKFEYNGNNRSQPFDCDENNHIVVNNKYGRKIGFKSKNSETKYPTIKISAY